MQIGISLTWYVLAFVSCQEQRCMKQESTPFGITPGLQPGWFLFKTNSTCWPVLPISSLLFYFQSNHKQHRSYSSFQKAAKGWKQLPTMLSSNSLNHSAGPKQIGKPLCCVSDWLAFWLSTSVPSTPPKDTGLFSPWLRNSSHSWAATAREVGTLSDRSKGTSVLGKTLLPNPFVVSFFLLPCLTPACSTRMQRAATGLPHLPSASTGECRSQQRETRCSVTTDHSHTALLLLDAHQSVIKAMAWFL